MQPNGLPRLGSSSADGLNSEGPFEKMDNVRIFYYLKEMFPPYSGSAIFGHSLMVSALATLAAFAAGPERMVAGNPIVDNVGLTDPHIAIFGDRAFLYGTHDFSPSNKGFKMQDWWVWSSSDLVNWKHEGTLKPEQTYLKKPFNDCWATFGASKNGKYYWYFSAGQNDIGVVVSDSPVGPWTDPLGKALIARGLTPTQQRDPDIMIDDDGKAYMVFGTFNHFIVRLNDDMISLAEPPRPLQLDHKFGPYGEGKTDDKPSLHKRNGKYYLSWSSFYAMSDNVYGPYIFKGSVIAPEKVAPEFVTKNIYHDRHGNFFTWHNQWYYACNDKSQPGRGEHYRDSIISYVHFRDNGEMAPVRIDRIGVGQYDAAAPRIEAEDFFDMKKGEVRELPGGGFEVRGLQDGSRLIYPNVRNLPKDAVVSFLVSSGHPAGGTIEVRDGRADGAILGACAIPNTGGWAKYQNIDCPLKNEPGTRSLCFIVKGGGGELLRLDGFSFHAANTREAK